VLELKRINFPMLLLATLVVLMFCLVGVALAFQSYLFMILFTVLGFSFMGYGLILKRQKSDS